MFGKVLFVAAVAVAVADAAVCSVSDALAANKIAPDAAKACTAETGFKAVKPTGYPDDAQLTLMCASDNCKTFIAALKTDWTLDCDFDFGGGSPVVNIKTVAEAFTPNCERLAGGGQTPVTTTPAPEPTTTAPPATTTPAPVPTTTAPPATTTPAPTPSVAPHC